MIGERRLCRYFAGLTAGLFVFVGAGTARAQPYQIPEESPVAEALQRAEAAIKAIVAVPAAQRNFDNTLGAIDDLIVHVRLDTEMLQFMANVSPDAKERERGSLAEEHVRSWFIELSKREDLYQAVKAYADTQPTLAGEQKRLLEHTLRDYRRAGMELSKEQRAALKESRREIEGQRNSLLVVGRAHTEEDRKELDRLARQHAPEQLALGGVRREQRILARHQAHELRPGLDPRDFLGDP